MDNKPTHSPIPASINNLDQEIERLRDAIQQIQERLTPVLGKPIIPEVPTTLSGEVKQVDYGVPLADKIGELTVQVTYHIADLLTTIDRIAV